MRVIHFINVNQRLLQVIIFISKKKEGIILVIIFCKKEGGIVDLQNMRKQGAKMEKLIFNFVDFLVKMIYARRLKANCFFLTS